jgi:uncharacterized repeat protein (TIGR01451 family)
MRYNLIKREAMKKILRIILILSLLSLFTFLGQDFKIPKAQAQEVHLTQCGTLSQANTTYILDNDVSSEKTCFTITASGITLDLNGHTVIYDNFPNTGLPNPGFENGNGEVPTDWDLSKAPSAKRFSNSTKPMAEKWHLFFDNPVTGEEIVSPWTNLPAASKVEIYFAKYNATWTYPNCLCDQWHTCTGPCEAPYIKVSVEYEDGSIVYASTPSQDTVEFTFTTANLSGKYRLHFEVNQSWGHDFGIDQLDMRPTGNYGVTGSGIVKNGRIVQGQAAGPHNHNINASKPEVYNLDLEASGIEAANVWAYWSSGKVINSNLVNKSIYKVSSRHQLSGALMFDEAGASVIISGNKITTGAGWGCIVYISRGAPNELIISGNYCSTRNTITNHHGIVTYGSNGAKIFNNIIEADPGQGMILSESTDSDVYNNTIYLKSQAPNLEYGALSQDGIRLNDYSSGNCKNTKVHDNNIFITGDYDNFYGAGGQVVNGICNVCSGTNNSFYNNYIKVNVVGNDVVGTGIEMGGTLGNPVVWQNNVIESNHKNVVFGGYTEKVYNVQFVSNTLIKGANPLADYKTFYSRHLSDVNDTHLIDTKLVNGASMESTDLYTAKYNYFVDWYLNLVVKDSSGQPIEGVNVVIANSDGSTAYSGTTNANGRIENITLNQYRKYGARWGDNPKGQEIKTPHTLTISKAGYQTETKTINMDSSKEMVVILDGQDSEPPVLSNIAVGNLTQNSATVSWQTDREADSKVEYGLDTNYGTTLTDTNLTTNHSIGLTNLSPNTYHFRVTSKDSSGKENVGVDHTFFILPLGVLPVSLTKSVDKTSASSGEILTYTINYSTNKDILNAKIEDPIPSGTTYVNGSATSGGTFDGTKVIWNLGNLDPGASGSVQFQVKVE